MPLKSGSSSKTISSNVKEIMDANKGNKHIGNTKKDMTKAEKIKQAVAISYAKAGKK